LLEIGGIVYNNPSDIIQMEIMEVAAVELILMAEVSSTNYMA
jgi:hypothetical protein